MIEVEVANGKRIDDCLKKVLRYGGRYPGYQAYDRMEIAQDNSLRDRDILVANRLGARMGPLPVETFKQNRARIEAALRSVPLGVALDDPWEAEESMWGTIEKAYRACWDYDIREARVTKVLHKKRPQLIPIVDGKMVIGRYYAEYSGPKKWGVPRMVAVTQRIREDMIENASSLRQLQKELLEKGIKLTRVRLFDMLLWEGYEDPGEQSERARRECSP